MTSQPGDRNVSILVPLELSPVIVLTELRRFLFVRLCRLEIPESDRYNCVSECWILAKHVCRAQSPQVDLPHAASLREKVKGGLRTERHHEAYLVDAGTDFR
jgi:hypothetical protein